MSKFQQFIGDVTMKGHVTLHFTISHDGAAQLYLYVYFCSLIGNIGDFCFYSLYLLHY